MSFETVSAPVVYRCISTQETGFQAKPSASSTPPYRAIVWATFLHNRRITKYPALNNSLAICNYPKNASRFKNVTNGHYSEIAVIPPNNFIKYRLNRHKNIYLKMTG